MAKTWHYTLDGAAAQILDEKTFVEHCREGKVTDAAMVWTAGMSSWQPYAELRAIEEANAEAAARKAAEKQAAAEAEAKIERRNCENCAKSWPMQYMVQTKALLLCRPCHTRKTEEARQIAERKAALKAQGGPSARFLLWFLTGAAALGAVGYFGFLYLKERWEAPPTEAPEKWAELPPEQWPQIVLSGEARMRDWPQPIRTVNNSLVVDGYFHVVGIGLLRPFESAAQMDAAVQMDAAHPVPGAKPVPNDLLRRRLNTSLTSWNIGPGTGAHATFTGLHGNVGAYGKSEVVLLDSSPPLTSISSLPVTPLRVRQFPTQKDMRLFVVGAPGGKQAVYPGKLHGTLDAKQVLDLEMDAPIDPDALTGAPILDDGGHLVGVVNGSFDSPDKYGVIRTLSGESLLSFAAPLGIAPGTPTPAAGDAPKPDKKTGALLDLRTKAKEERQRVKSEEVKVQ